MSKIELYKKYRPRKWKHMIGQEKTVESLINMVKNNNVPTALLFSGTHGSGKTTAALILAKAINCEKTDENANPCNKCELCVAVDKNNGSIFGIHTLSMANNGSVDEVRKIMNNANLATIAKKPVYILDECHNISKTAQESMLIPLEKDNANALFVLCSTDPDKIISTIHSRVARRNFTPVDKKAIFGRLKEICTKEEIELSDDELVAVTNASRGSVRDSIKYLQEYIETGSIPSAYKIRMLEALINKKYTDMFKLVAEMADDGQSFTKICEQLYGDVRDLIVASAENKNVKENTPAGRIIKEVPLPTLLKILNVIGTTLEKMATNVIDSRVLFEVCLTTIIAMLRKT